MTRDEANAFQAFGMTCAAVLTAAVVILAFGGMVILMTSYSLPVLQWECTQVEIVKVSLPKAENCTQYTRKAKP